MGELVDTPKIEEILKIDKTALDEELSTQSGKYFFHSERAINADLAFESYKGQVGALEATLDKKIRGEAAAAGQKLTETGIRMEIERSPEYSKAAMTLLTLRGRREVLKAVREAFFMRKDMLIQLAIKARGELAALGAETV